MAVVTRRLPHSRTASGRSKGDTQLISLIALRLFVIDKHLIYQLARPNGIMRFHFIDTVRRRRTRDNRKLMDSKAGDAISGRPNILKAVFFPFFRSVCVHVG